jgi:hypothetical protein
MIDALSAPVPTDDELTRALEQLAWHFSPDPATKRALIDRTIMLIAEDPFTRANMAIEEALFITMGRAFNKEFSRSQSRLAPE